MYGDLSPQLGHLWFESRQVDLPTCRMSSPTSPSCLCTVHFQINVTMVTKPLKKLYPSVFPCLRQFMIVIVVVHASLSCQSSCVPHPGFLSITIRVHLWSPLCAWVHHIHNTTLSLWTTVWLPSSCVSLLCIMCHSYIALVWSVLSVVIRWVKCGDG